MSVQLMIDSKFGLISICITDILNPGKRFSRYLSSDNSLYMIEFKNFSADS